MRYVVGLLLVAFAVAGIGFFALGLRDLIRRARARRRLRPVEGEVVSIETRSSGGLDSNPTTSNLRHFPVIRFRHESQGESRFTAEIGNSGQTSRYTVGQKIDVLYDPEGQLAPMINSWAGIWFVPLLRFVVGSIFIGAAVLLYVAFGDRILGR